MITDNTASSIRQAGTANDQLIEKHSRELYEGSGIAEGVASKRGYKSISEKEARLVGYSEEQAGAGLLIPFYSPTGEISYQLKRDNPRTDKRGKPIKYETRSGHDITLDVHPDNYPRLLEGNEPFIVTEGIKKADSAATAGRLTLGLGGTWMWGKKRVRGGAKYGKPELLWDWDVIPLEGRAVYICFDADYREKQGVALAMLRLAERLTERGARVYIMNLPGPEKGLDDYLVGGGSLDELERDARPFTPSDLIRYAIKPDKRIQEGVGRLARAMDGDEWAGWDSTSNSLLRTFLELALLGGRYNKDDDSAEVMMGARELRGYAAIGSYSTLMKHTAKLEERGYITKEVGDRKTGKANRYILKFAKGVTVIEEGEGNSTPVTPLENFAPHLRWPGPTHATVNGDERDSKLPKATDKPENLLEHRPTLASIYHGVDGEAPPRPKGQAEPEVAMGKTVEMALHLLLSWGGDGPLRDLSETTGVNDTSKLRKKLEAAGQVFEIDPKGKHGARVRLSEDWQRRLDERRESAGEFRRSRQQAIKNRQAREMFRKPDDEPVACDPQPELMGPERFADVKARADERAREARIEEQRRKVGMTAQVFLDDALAGAISGFGWRELRALWIAKGGRSEDLRLAVKDPYMFKREAGDGHLYVERRSRVTETIAVATASADHEPAPVAILREPSFSSAFAARMPEKGEDGIYHHDAFCDCDWCDTPIEPRYATLRGGA